MAVLDELNRALTSAHFVRLGGWVTLAKADIRAALDYTDAWIDTNQATYNAGLPEPFASEATVEQKTILFCLVAMRRAGLLATEGD